MASNICPTANLHKFANGSATCNCRTTRHYRALIDNNIMSDLTEIIYFDIVVNNGVFDSSAIDAGVGTDFDIVTNFNNANLHNFVINAVMMGETKAVLPDFCPAINLTIIADDGKTNGGISIDDGVVANDGAI